MLNVLDCDHSKEDLQEDTKQSATEKKRGFKLWCFKGLTKGKL